MIIAHWTSHLGARFFHGRCEPNTAGYFTRTNAIVLSTRTVSVGHTNECLAFAVAQFFVASLNQPRSCNPVRRGTTLRGITRNEQIRRNWGYDVASLTLAALCLVLLFNLRDRLPVFLDGWYHLSVIRAFAERGFTTHAWWEFAPFGRPHLYPPLFHLANAGFVRLTGAELLSVARFWSVVTFPLVLLAGWAAARSLFGKRAAWLTVLLMALNIGLLFPCSLILMPGTLALLLWPWVQRRVLRKDWMGGAIVLTLMAYLHFGVTMVAAASLIVLAAGKRECRRSSFAVLAVAGGLYAPWLIHLWRHREYLHSAVANLPVFMPVFTVAGLICGVLAFYRSRDAEALAVVSMILASGLFWFTVRERFWTYGGFLFALVGGYGLDRVGSRSLKWLMPVLVVSALSATPFLKPPRMKLALPAPFQSSPVLMPAPLPALVAWQREPMEPVPAEVLALTDWIRQNVPENDVILTKEPIVCEIIFALTGRRTTHGMWSEVMTPALEKQLAAHRRTAAGYIVAGTGDSPEGATPVATFGRYRVFYRDGPAVGGRSAARPAVAPCRHQKTVVGRESRSFHLRDC